MSSFAAVVMNLLTPCERFAQIGNAEAYCHICSRKINDKRSVRLPFLQTSSIWLLKNDLLQLYT